LHLKQFKINHLQTKIQINHEVQQGGRAHRREETQNEEVLPSLRIQAERRDSVTHNTLWILARGAQESRVAAEGLRSPWSVLQKLEWVYGRSKKRWAKAVYFKKEENV
jgi:hypothetical protein